jgi:hypothetical protein
LTRKFDTGRDPSDKELREAERVTQLHPLQQKEHPSTLAADTAQLDHVNTYGELPEFYIDRPFVCRTCGKREIWRARDQKWYYEQTNHPIDAVAVECHGCRKDRKREDT